MFKPQGYGCLHRAATPVFCLNLLIFRISCYFCISKIWGDNKTTRLRLLKAYSVCITAHAHRNLCSPCPHVLIHTSMPSLCQANFLSQLHFILIDAPAPFRYLKMKMKSMSSIQKVATLSIVFISTTSCRLRAGINLTSLMTLSSLKVLSTDRPPSAWPMISHTLG